MLPPSVTVPVAARLTVVTSIVSGTVVVAAAVATCRLLNPPPVVPEMVADTLLASA